MGANRFDRKFYVAYGSNMNIGQMEYRCPTATLVGKVEIPGYKLTFRGGLGAVANIEIDPDGVVPAALWIIDDKAETRLDLYEGYPFMYRKEVVPIRLEDGHEMHVMAYLMNIEKPRVPHGYPSQRYYKTIQEGYKNCGWKNKLNYLRTMANESSEQMKQLVYS